MGRWEEKFFLESRGRTIGTAILSPDHSLFCLICRALQSSAGPGQLPIGPYRYFAHSPIIDSHPLSCMVVGCTWFIDKISVPHFHIRG